MDWYCLTCFLMVTFVITLACMVLLAACGTLFFSRPFEGRFISYSGNSIIWVMVAESFLFRLWAEKAVRNGFVYGREWEKRKRFERLDLLIVVIVSYLGIRWDDEEQSEPIILYTQPAYNIRVIHGFGYLPPGIFGQRISPPAIFEPFLYEDRISL